MCAMEILKNSALKNLNTFGVDVNTTFYSEIHNMDDIAGLINWKNTNKVPMLLLGGGSNLLFKEDYAGLVAKVCLSGKDIAEEDDKHVYVSVAGGENWHDFVRWTVEQGMSGLENLSLIPGTVGAAPIQNIGAYGVELADHFHSLQAVDLESAEVLEYQKSACDFGYRESFFKSQTLDKLLITSVTFALPKKPNWKIDYAGVREILEGVEPTAELISNAIIELRQSKLPDPAKIGNAGSFFKNPVLNIEKWQDLKEWNPTIPGYVQEGGDMKTSAAWLIDQCGWKGYRKGDAGVSDKHALVLVNYGNATGAELWAVAQEIMTSVEERFGVLLEAEPRVI
ncbi:MAG: UDP-N-acetylmuramate dehydrogenase [Cocleimonas sp.]